MHDGGGGGGGHHDSGGHHGGGGGGGFFGGGGHHHHQHQQFDAYGNPLPMRPVNRRWAVARPVLNALLTVALLIMGYFLTKYA